MAIMRTYIAKAFPVQFEISAVLKPDGTPGY